MALEVIPSVDLRNGAVVRLKQGDYNQQLTYGVDPIEQALQYTRIGARWFHIVDLDGAQEGRPVQTDLIRRIIHACHLNVQVGGGVRGTDDIDRLLEAGANRVVVGTKAVEDWPWFERLVKTPRYENRIVLALDARDGIVATRGWTASSGRKAVDIAQAVSDWPLAAILYTDVAKDGMLAGPNVEQTARLADAGNVPVIASGGVRDLSHIAALAQINAWGVVVGRSLYEGTLDLREALELGRTSNRQGDD